MKTSSKKEFNALSPEEQDKELKNYWGTNKFVFYAEFVPETEEPRKRSGKFVHLRVPGSSIDLKYPFEEDYVSIVVPRTKAFDRGFFSLECRRNGSHLQAILSTCRPISESQYRGEAASSKPQSEPLAPYVAEGLVKDERYKALSDNFHGWGKYINRLLGVYHVSSDGVYYFDNIHTENYKSADEYPNHVKLERLEIHTPIKNAHEDHFCSFSWKFTNRNSSNPYEIEVDENKSISPVSAKSLVTTLYDDALQNDSRSADVQGNSVEVIKSQISGQDPCTFLYELLQNASDYPYDGKVDVEIHLTRDYLVFRHSGMPFSGMNVLGLCNVGDGGKAANEDTIGYKGIGFKNVFIENDYVYVKSEDYSFAFDERATGKNNYATTPVWVDDDKVDSDIKNILAENANRFRVNFVLKPRNKSTLFEAEDSYRNRLHEVFDSIRKIVFISNINKVSVYIDGESPIVCSRTEQNNGWVISDQYKEPVKKEIHDRLVKEIDDKTGRAPEKLRNKRNTSVCFACLLTGKELEAVRNPNIYCYLPTSANFGFPFLINTEMIPTGDRNDIETREFWNLEVAEIAGSKFFDWIRDLVKGHLYTYPSIFSLIPDFNDCVLTHEKYKDFIERFKKGFEDRFLTEPIFPKKDGTLISFDNLINDTILLMKDEAVFTDEFFYKYYAHENAWLPAKELRCGSFVLLINRYSDKVKFSVTKDLILGNVDSDIFQDWVKIPDNNKKFLRFLLNKDYILDFKDKKIFIDDKGNTCISKDVYYNVDDELSSLTVLSAYLPHLSVSSRTFLESFKSKWNDDCKGMFKKYDIDTFIQNDLLDKNNIQDVHKKLTDKNASLKFYDYIAKNSAKFVSALTNLPFIDSDDKVVSNFNIDGFIFMDSKDGKLVKKALWMDESWLNFISPDYSEAAQKYFKEAYKVNEFSNKFIANNILLKDPYKTSIKSKIQDLENSRETNKANYDFVIYCFNNKENFADDALSGFPLRIGNYKVVTSSGEPETSGSELHDYYALPEEHIYFASPSFANMLKKGWLGKEWMFSLSSIYFYKLNDEKEKDLKVFLTKKFGVKEFSNNSFFDDVVSHHLKDIFITIGKDKLLNYDFISFLNSNYQHIFKDNLNNVKKFEVIPLVDTEDKIISVNPNDTKGIDISENGVHTYYRYYLYSSELEKLMELPWMQNGPVFMANKDYGDSKALEAIGLAKFDFSDFFTHVIATDNIKYIVSTLKDFESNKAFHDFLIKNVTDLKQFKTIKENVPVYILGHDEPAALCTGHQILSQAAQEIFDLKLVESKDLDIIDTRYNPQENYSYWTDKDRLDNKTFTINHFVSWLKSHHDDFVPKLKDHDANIKFWRWARKKLAENTEAVKDFPVLTKGKEIAFASLDSTIYMSDRYKETSGFEDLVKSLSGVNGASIISDEYIEEGDNIKDWYSFWSKLNVRNDEVDILWYTVLPNISTYKIDSLFKRFALNRKELLAKDPDLVRKLTSIQIKCDSGSFFPIKDVLYIDCDKVEPFKMIGLDNAVTLETADEKTLMDEILKLNIGKRISGLNDWRKLKIERYIKIQGESIDNIKPIHYQFINEFCKLYSADTTVSYTDLCGKIKLETKSGEYLLGKDITMGKAYQPFCDFESYGIELYYLSESYQAKCSEAKVPAFLRINFALHHDLKESDFKYLAKNWEFAVYIWSDYLTSKYGKNYTIPHLGGFIRDHKLDDIACIPTRDKVRNPKELYSPKIEPYIREISSMKGIDNPKDYANMLPYMKLEQIESDKDSSKSLFDLLPFKDRLEFSDCILGLFCFKDIKIRAQLVEWMVNPLGSDPSTSDQRQQMIDDYRSDKNATWLNAVKKDKAISSLYALDDSSKKLQQWFGTNPLIINKQYFLSPSESDEEIQEKACRVLKIQIIHEEEISVIPHPKSNSGDESWKKFFCAIALLIAGIENNEDWQSIYSNYKGKIMQMKLIECSSISITCSNVPTINRDKLKFYHSTKESPEFFFVGDSAGSTGYNGYKNPLVFLDFIDAFQEYLDTDFDKDLLEEYLILSLKALKDEYLEQVDLLDDDAFRNAAATFFPEFVNYRTDEDGADTEQLGPSSYGRHAFSEEQEDNRASEEKDTGNESTGEQTSEEESHSTSNEMTSHSHESERTERRNPEDGEQSAQDTKGDSNPNSKSQSHTKEYSEERKKQYGRNNVDGQSETPHKNSGSSHRNYGEPHPFTAEQVAKFKSEGQPLTIKTAEATEKEVGDINALLGEDRTAEEIADANYLAQLRLYNSLKDRGDVSDEDDMADFIREGSKKNDIKLSSGKWIHKCSAAGGILYLSPKVWNMVRDDRYVVCVYLGAKQNEFLYLNSYEDVLTLIGRDSIIIKLTGKDRDKVVNELYSGVLDNVTGDAYTMIRVASNEKYNSFFENVMNTGTDNENDY